MRLTDDPNYHNEWYRRNKHRLAEARRRRNREEYRALKQYIKYRKLKAGACSVCGLECTDENHVAFDWDHIDRSTKRFDLGSSTGKSIGTVGAEIDKCRLICKICHAIHTHAEGHWQPAEPDKPEQPTLFD